MKKQLLSIAMAASMVFAYGSVIPEKWLDTEMVHVSAVAGSETLDSLKVKYPQGSTWTGPYVRDGWTFNRCIGYAAVIANELYGSFFINWPHDTDLSSLKPGDVILTKYTSKYMGDGKNHAVVVTKVSGNDVYITDCNANNDNVIHWDTKKNKSSFSSTSNWNNSINGVYHAPSEASSEPSQAAPEHSNTENVKEGKYNLLNLGTNFYMNYAWGIANSPIWMSAADGSPEQIFTLEYQGDGKYEMHIDHSDGGVVNVDSYSPAVGDWINRYDDKDNDTQRFYFVNVGEDEYIIENAADPNAVIGSPYSELHTKLRLSKYKEDDKYIRWKLIPVETQADSSSEADSSEPESSLPDSSVPDDSSLPDAPKAKLGDVNADGKIDIEDAVRIINHVNGVTALKDDEAARADVDGSNKVDIVDAVSIISHVNGLKVIG